MAELKITSPNCFNEEKCFEDVQDQEGKKFSKATIGPIKRTLGTIVWIIAGILLAAPLHKVLALLMIPAVRG